MVLTLSLAKPVKSNRLLKRPMKYLPHLIMAGALVIINLSYYLCAAVTLSLPHPFLAHTYSLGLFLRVQPSWGSRVSTQALSWTGPGWDLTTSLAPLSPSTVKPDTFYRYSRVDKRFLIFNFNIMFCIMYSRYSSHHVQYCISYSLLGFSC